MRVQTVIDTFQTAIKNGWMKPDDEIAINWWSIEDVDHYDEELTDDQKKKVWDKVLEELSTYDDFDNDTIQRLISEAINEVVPNV